MTVMPGGEPECQWCVAFPSIPCALHQPNRPPVQVQIPNYAWPS